MAEENGEKWQNKTIEMQEDFGRTQKFSSGCLWGPPHRQSRKCWTDGQRDKEVSYVVRRQ